MREGKAKVLQARLQATERAREPLEWLREGKAKVLRACLQATERAREPLEWFAITLKEFI